MQLLPNWKKVLFGRWSNRLAVVVSLLGAAQVIVPAFQDSMSRGRFAVLMLLVALAIPVVSVIQQEELHEEEVEEATEKTHG